MRSLRVIIFWVIRWATGWKWTNGSGYYLPWYSNFNFKLRFIRLGKILNLNIRWCSLAVLTPFSTHVILMYYGPRLSIANNLKIYSNCPTMDESGGYTGFPDSSFCASLARFFLFSFLLLFFSFAFPFSLFLRYLASWCCFFLSSKWAWGSSWIIQVVWIEKTAERQRGPEKKMKNSFYFGDEYGKQTGKTFGACISPGINASLCQMIIKS